MSPGRAAKRLLGGLLDLLLPPRCAACDALVTPGESFCVPCAVGLMGPTSPCPRCGEPRTTPRARCPRCRHGRPAFDTLSAPLLYGGPVADAIAKLKYQRRSDLAPQLARLFRPLLAALPELDLVVPVPLHPQRLARRGYNQATLLARPVARALRRPLCCDALLRQRDTPSQTHLTPAQRRANVVGAFIVPRAERLDGRRVLLVDDVATTGATLDACAAALLASSAARVDALVLARAEGTGSPP